MKNPLIHLRFKQTRMFLTGGGNQSTHKNTTQTTGSTWKVVLKLRGRPPLLGHKGTPGASENQATKQ